MEEEEEEDYCNKLILLPDDGDIILDTVEEIIFWIKAHQRVI